MASLYPKRQDYASEAEFERALWAFYTSDIRGTTKVRPLMWRTEVKRDVPDRENEDLLILQLIREELKRVKLAGWEPVAIDIQADLYDWLVHTLRHNSFRTPNKLYGVSVDRNPALSGGHAPIMVMARRPDGSLDCVACATERGEIPE